MIGIIGYGWVGKAMYELFPKAFVYSNHFIIDHDGSSIDIPTGDVKEYRKEINKCDVVFVCVPTPNTEEKELDTSMVEECVAWCKAPLIVIRSTVNPGTCDRLSRKYNKRIVMQPEYLGETPNHPMYDQKTRQFLVIGGNPEDRKEVIELYQTVYNANTTIRQITALEAEIIKLTENRAIAFKVAECQELYDVCQEAGIDYYTIRDAVYGDDPRMTLWWTFVYPNKRGFNSKCLPKDVYAWAAWAESVGYDPKITKSILKKNKQWL